MSPAASSPVYLMLSLSKSTTTPILNKDGQVIAVLAGRPTNEDKKSWKALHDIAYNAMKSARKNAYFASNTLHRRGKFSALVTGASFGGGQKVGLCEALAECCLYLNCRCLGTSKTQKRMKLF